MTITDAAADITATLDREDVPAFTPAGYERAKELLAAQFPHLSGLQIATIAGKINRSRE